MCGRYALALRLSQIRRMLQDDDMPVWDAPEDEGGDAPRQSYNFAPGYHGVVYRADVPDHGAGPSRQRGASTSNPSRPQEGKKQEQEDEPEDEQPTGATEAESTTPQDTAAATSKSTETRYKLQSMKWGLVPFWTKRNPDYASLLRTINCRDDSLAASGGMWSTMKARKRCVVVAQGFYEWLAKGPKERVPHYIRRRDGKLLLLAGLWDCVTYEEGEGDSKNYTYTIITTDSSPALKFLHDRMPVVLEPGSDALRAWLDPGRHEWTRELQALLRPWDGELDVDVVSKEVNKVGASSPSFIIPVASRENKHNIANFFANTKPPKKTEGSPAKTTAAVSPVMATEGKLDGVPVTPKQKVASPFAAGVKREAMSSPGSPPSKMAKTSRVKPSPAKPAASRGKISATSNGTKTPSKDKADGSQKITKFFGNSA